MWVFDAPTNAPPARTHRVWSIRVESSLSAQIALVCVNDDFYPKENGGDMLLRMRIPRTGSVQAGLLSFLVLFWRRRCGRSCRLGLPQCMLL